MKKYIITSVVMLAVFTAFIPASFAGNYDVDKAHSSIAFNVKHMVLAKVNGKFADYDVDLNYDEKDITKSSVSAAIKVSSIDTGVKDRDNHLKSSDFFDSEKFPEIKFVSSKVKKSGDSYILSGSLTMRGVTKQVDILFKYNGTLVDPWGNTRAGFEGNLTVNRLDYGISWSKTLDNGGLVVDDKVNIELLIEAIKKK